jgi:hypothetical protein
VDYHLRTYISRVWGYVWSYSSRGGEGLQLDDVADALSPLALGERQTRTLTKNERFLLFCFFYIRIVENNLLRERHRLHWKAQKSAIGTDVLPYSSIRCFRMICDKQGLL